jgi:hypothetical protein
MLPSFLIHIELPPGSTRRQQQLLVRRKVILALPLVEPALLVRIVSQLFRILCRNQASRGLRG